MGVGPLVQDYNYGFIETFAGNAAASKAFRAAYPATNAAALDIAYTSSMDINSPSGFGLLYEILGVEQEPASA